MKYLYLVTILLIAQGCQKVNNPSPSQNTTLNAISNSTAATKEKGWLQRYIEDSSKTQNQHSNKNKPIHKNNTIKEKHNQKPLTKKSNEQRGALQGFFEDHFNLVTTDDAHIDELNKLPVIGNEK